MDSEDFSSGVQFIQLSHNSPLVCEAKKLLTEYGDYMYNDLGLTAGKVNFFKDLEQFPTSNYLPPTGAFFLVRTGNTFVGCVGIKKLDQDSCEMKRLFVHSSFRGKGIGRLLCDYVIECCRKKGYKRILLDTNFEMKEAVALYHKCGFKEIKPYCVNENDHPIFMEFIL